MIITSRVTIVEERFRAGWIKLLLLLSCVLSCNGTGTDNSNTQDPIATRAKFAITEIVSSLPELTELGDTSTRISTNHPFEKETNLGIMFKNGQTWLLGDTDGELHDFVILDSLNRLLFRESFSDSGLTWTFGTGDAILYTRIGNVEKLLISSAVSTPQTTIAFVIDNGADWSIDTTNTSIELEPNLNYGELLAATDILQRHKSEAGIAPNGSCTDLLNNLEKFLSFGCAVYNVRTAQAAERLAETICKLNDAFWDQLFGSKDVRMREIIKAQFSGLCTLSKEWIKVEGGAIQWIDIARGTLQASPLGIACRSTDVVKSLYGLYYDTDVEEDFNKWFCCFVIDRITAGNSECGCYIHVSTAVLPVVGYKEYREAIAIAHCPGALPLLKFELLEDGFVTASHDCQFERSKGECRWIFGWYPCGGELELRTSLVANGLEEASERVTLYPGDLGLETGAVSFTRDATFGGYSVRGAFSWSGTRSIHAPTAVTLYNDENAVANGNVGLRKMYFRGGVAEVSDLRFSKCGDIGSDEYGRCAIKRIFGLQVVGYNYINGNNVQIVKDQQIEGYFDLSVVAFKSGGAEVKVTFFPDDNGTVTINAITRETRSNNSIADSGPHQSNFPKGVVISFD